MEERTLTGYPSIDKPWLKYYSMEAINTPIPEKTLYQYMYDNNKEYTCNIALNYFGRKITYATLFENIENAAKAFMAIGINKGDIVTIMSMHTPETIYCVYALNRLGAVANMVYMTLSEKELLHEVKNTGSKALVILDLAIEKVNKVDEELGQTKVIVISPAKSMKILLKTGYLLKERPPKLRKNYLSYGDFIGLAKNADKVTDVEFEKYAPAIIAHTSGTTGKPKGVMLSNYNLNALVHQYRTSGITIERGETFFNMLPPFVGFGISFGMHLPLALGLEEILWILCDPVKAAEGFIKHKPKHFVCAPTCIDEIMSRLREKMDFVATFAGGGESLTLEKEIEINQFIQDHGGNVKYLTGYGMTEFGATVCTGMNHIYKLGTLGIPLPSVNIKIIDSETNNELGYNQTGEMCFCAPNTMLGYFRDEEATKEVIKDHQDGSKWVHTDDLGYVDEEGFVHYVGRKKRIFFARGEDGLTLKIFPMRVEELFTNRKEIQFCGVIVIPDEERINVMVAFVSQNEKNQSKKSLASELLGFAKQELPQHSVPVRIVVLDEMPLTQSGKVDYHALEQIEMSNREI